MPPPKDKPNPLWTPSDDFTPTIHSESYAAIDPSKAELGGKNVVIVGGTKGIGRAITMSFAKAGAASIAVGGRSDQPSLEDDIKAAAKSAGKTAPQVLLCKLDITDPRSIDSAARDVEKHFSKLDILILNSGIFTRSNIGESNPEEWWNVFDTNLRGPYLAFQAFLPLMQNAGMGQIVIVSSIGALHHNPGLSAYQISKLAVLRFAEFIDAEYADKGILAFCIHPGNVPGTGIIPGGVPEEVKHVFTETPELSGDTIVYLTQEKRQWLGGRYISCTWDMPEFLAKKDEIINKDKLKMVLGI